MKQRRELDRHQILRTGNRLAITPPAQNGGKLSST